jgi:small conductance mechanosensitive channel
MCKFRTQPFIKIRFAILPQSKASDDFIFAIPFGKSLSEAQEIALRTVKGHPAVLKQPEPWILVHCVDTARDDLKVYYWFDGVENMLIVRSSVMR